MLGERIGVVGALSIEAARASQARDLDGIVIGEGFSTRVVDAFLTVLTEEARFRNLPVVVSGPGLDAEHADLANLEMVAGDSDTVAATALPLLRQHAFEARLGRTLKSIESDGLLDPATGLLTTTQPSNAISPPPSITPRPAAADCRWPASSFANIPLRAQLDAARIIAG